MAMLFADAVHFSHLEEHQIPLFVREFLGAIGALIADSEHAPVSKNTWGDGLYFVFTGVEHAARFALDLAQRIGTTRWTEKGLPETLNLRIALHAGSVYPCTDPITGSQTYSGAHVSRAARIEPVTPPGEVYASEAFAALAAATGARGFACDYVGQTSFAKDYGRFPLYHVRRAGA